MGRPASAHHGHTRWWSPGPSLCLLGSAQSQPPSAPPSSPHSAEPPGGPLWRALLPASQLFCGSGEKRIVFNVETCKTKTETKTPTKRWFVAIMRNEGSDEFSGLSRLQISHIEGCKDGKTKRVRRTGVKQSLLDTTGPLDSSCKWLNKI